MANIMDCVKPIFESMFPSVVEQIRTIIQLEKAADTLIKETRQLRDLKADKESGVLVQERDPTMRRTHQAKTWLEDVDALAKSVEIFDELFVTRPSSCCCSFGCCWSHYKLSRRAAELLGQVQELTKRIHDQDLAVLVAAAPPDTVEAVASSAPSITGGKQTLAEIRQHVRHGEAGVIGIVGMGGIGKTTLLTQICNEFVVTGTRDFDMVIWATVSKEADVQKVQEQIANGLGLSLPSETEDRAKLLSKALSKKKFLLLLDDVWKKLDLNIVGIPRPDAWSKSKIAFTTRWEQVCVDIDADATVSVRLLDAKESWELFCEKLGALDVLRDPSIRSMAKRIVEKCGGLPLALVTVGRAMANKKTVKQWQHASNELEKTAYQFRGLKDDVLSLLKYSYDELESDTLRTCLLYCALFPEDHEIRREQLVEYWIGEGFLDVDEAGRHINDDGGDFDAVRCKGDDLIGMLQDACLLLSGRYEEEKKVKMHDEVREMAFWITSAVDSTNKQLVHAGKGPQAAPPKVERWKDAKRISLMHNTNLILSGEMPPNCPNVNTLLMNGNPYTGTLPDEFFQFMPVLRVLDLSSARIYSLPSSIGSLVELQYLNISSTRMVSLPRELGKLTKLQQLDMSFTSYLLTIPHEAISTLLSLQVWNLYCSNYKWSWEQSSTTGNGEQQERATSLKDLEGLQHLSELGLDIRGKDCLEGLIRSAKLLKFVKLLSLTVVAGLTAGELVRMAMFMEGLRVLQLNSCSDLGEELGFGDYYRLLYGLEDLVLKYLSISRVVVEKGDGRAPPLQGLRRLEILGCHGLKEITWAGRLKCLESLEVNFCDGMEELVSGEVVEEEEEKEWGECWFPMLKGMDLRQLPALRSVAGKALLLPSMEKVSVYNCPELKRLPLGPRSGKKMKLIRGQQQWWDGLDWGEEPDTIKSIFLPHFTDPWQQP